MMRHQFKPAGDDEQKIEYIFNVFMRGGPRMTYTSSSRPVPSRRVAQFSTEKELREAVLVARKLGSHQKPQQAYPDLSSS